jgi:putative transposase
MTHMTQPFDFEQALKALLSGQDLNGKNGILTPLIKQLTEAKLKVALEPHLAIDTQSNRKAVQLRNQSSHLSVALN